MLKPKKSPNVERWIRYLASLGGRAREKVFKSDAAPLASTRWLATRPTAREKKSVIQVVARLFDPTKTKRYQKAPGSVLPAMRPVKQRVRVRPVITLPFTG